MPRSAAAHALQVDGMKDVLAGQEKELKVKNDDANRLITIVGKETAVVQVEKNIGDVSGGVRRAETDSSRCWDSLWGC